MAESGRLLLAASSDTVLKLLRFYLTREGYQLETARTSDFVMKFMGDQVFDAVICDESLTGTDSLQLVRQLRASPLTQLLPVILLGGNASDPRIQAALKLGPTQFLKRDARVEAIGDALKSMLSGAEGEAVPGVKPAAHTITILSPRGGSGKTFLATNLGVVLAQRPGETTVLADLNLEFGTTAMMLDLRPLYTLRDVAEAAMGDVSDTEFDGMLLRHSSGLRVLPAVAQPGDSELIPEGALPRIMERLRRLYDNVVVDGRPSFREFMLDLWEASNTMLVTCPPEVVSVLVTRTLLEAFSVVGVDNGKLLVVLNHVASKARLSAAQVERGLNCSTFTIPHGGELLQRSIDTGKPLVLDHPAEPAAVAIRRLADQLVQRYTRQRRSQAS
ncbi:MAG: response regulator/pilus assembly protein [Candidatus Dormibacteria bacterium]